MQNSKSVTSLPLTFSFTASLTTIVAESRATLAGHHKATLGPLDNVLTIWTELPAFFGSKFLHSFCLLILRTKLAWMCF